MRSKIFILIIVSVILTGFSGCGYMAKKYLKTKTQEFTVPSAGKKELRLENISGDITIKQGGDSSDIIIKTTRQIKVKKKDLETPFDEIEIIIESEDSEVNISSEINSKQGNSFFKFGTGNKAKVDYEIIIPNGIDLKIENVNGNISLNNLANDVNLDLVNGKTEVDNCSGQLNCEIVNGTFTGEIKETKGIDINTINGSVSLNLNNFINATISAETINGKISDSNLQIREIEKEKRLFKGILGSGNSDIRIIISTVNGKIKFTGTNEI